MGQFKPPNKEVIRIADNLISKMPREGTHYWERKKDGLPPHAIVHSSPVGMKLDFAQTEEERRFLYEVASRYQKFPTVEPLLAHGTSHVRTLCQILCDGMLFHISNRETYGVLGKEDIQVGGHWDNGVGLFVGRKSVIRKFRTEKPFLQRGEELGVPGSYGDSWYAVPLSSLEAIVLPKEVVWLFRDQFPAHGHVLTSYNEYAQRLEEWIRELGAHFPDA